MSCEKASDLGFVGSSKIHSLCVVKRLELREGRRRGDGISREKRRRWMGEHGGHFSLGDRGRGHLASFIVGNIHI